MRVLKNLLNVFRAEFMLTLTDITRRKLLLITMIAYPYVLAMFIVLIGSSVGSYSSFKLRLGMDPIPFFVMASYLMMTVLGVIDEVLWRPVHDSMIGTFTYVILSPINRVTFYLIVPLPRLALSTLLNAPTLLPIMLIYYGTLALLITGLVVSFALISAFLMISFSVLVLGTFYYLLGQNWRLLNIVRPLLLIVTGIYYPRYLMPLTLKLISTLLPSSSTVELLYRILLNVPTTTQYVLSLIGVATALALIYLPLSSLSVGAWVRKSLIRGEVS